MDKAKEEYFELLRQLNKSNKTKNILTQLTFIVEGSNKYQGMLYASISKDQKALLCIQSGNVWRPAGFSRYDHLEKFICSHLRSATNEIVTDLILRNLFKHTE